MLFTAIHWATRTPPQTSANARALVHARSVCTTKDNNILRKTNCQVNIYEQRATACACVADDTRRGPRGASLSIRWNLLRLLGAAIAGGSKRRRRWGRWRWWLRKMRREGRERTSSRTRARNLCSHYATTEIHYERHELSRGFGDGRSIDRSKDSRANDKGAEASGQEGREYSWCAFGVRMLSPA